VSIAYGGGGLAPYEIALCGSGMAENNSCADSATHMLLAGMAIAATNWRRNFSGNSRNLHQLSAAAPGNDGFTLSPANDGGVSVNLGIIGLLPLAASAWPFSINNTATSN